MVVQDNFKFGDDKEIVSIFVAPPEHLVLTCPLVDCCVAEQRSRDQQEEPQETHSKFSRHAQQAPAE